MVIAAVAGSLIGRILAVDSVDRQALQQMRLAQIPRELQKRRAELSRRGLSGEQLEQQLSQLEAELYRQALICRPFLSANDRSRWCTVRALVEPEMRIPGKPYAIDRVIQEPNWDTIDMVKHGGHLYSSKPPLLSTLVAGTYWVLYQLSGYSLGSHPYLVGRSLLIFWNVLPMVGYLIVIGLLAERFGTSNWGRTFVVIAAGWGTFLTTFATTLNNHLPAAVCTAAALFFLTRIYVDRILTPGTGFWCGLFAALAAANEMPALGFLALCAFGVIWSCVKSWREGRSHGKKGQIAGSDTAEKLPATPARNTEQSAGECPSRPWSCLAVFWIPVMVVAVAYFGTNWIAHGSLRPPYLHRSPTNPEDNWYIFTYERQGRTLQSYWTNPVGVDRGEPSAAVYAFHVLIGHHGVFSLTPLWLLVPAGLWLWLAEKNQPRLRGIAATIALISLACLLFYIFRPQMDRNYGGVTSGFRWSFWMSSLWLTAILPVADRLATRRWGRAVALILLTLSALSAAYPTWNPWVHPWIYEWMYHLGGIQN